MARVTRFQAKLGTMRKAADWIVYPASIDGGDGTLVIQSDTRIARINPATGKGILSKAKSGGAYFMHLSTFLGATEIDVPAEVIALATAHQPKSGDTIGAGVYVA